MPKNRSIGNIKWIGDDRCILRVSAGYDDYGKRIQISRTVDVKSETDAERQLLALYNERNKISQDRVTEAPKTLGGLYEEFKTNHIEKLRPNTQDYYTKMWDRYLDGYKKTKLKSLTPKMIYDIINRLSVGDRTKRAVYNMLSTMCNRGVNWGYIGENPCEKADPPKYKAKEKRPYTEEEIASVIAEISKEPARNQLIFYCAAMLGMRRSEIVGLQWTDIDFENETLSIRRAAGRSVGNGTYTGETKNARSARTLNLPAIMRDLFMEHKEQQDQKRVKLGSKWAEGDWIFTKWNGEIMSVDTPTSTWTDFLTAHPELPKTTLHALRHTAATLLIKNNVAVSTVSGILGHAQISTTLNIYTHAIEDAKKEALRTMETIFKHTENTSEKA